MSYLSLCELLLTPWGRIVRAYADLGGNRRPRAITRIAPGCDLLRSLALESEVPCLGPWPRTRGGSDEIGPESIGFLGALRTCYLASHTPQEQEDPWGTLVRSFYALEGVFTQSFLRVALVLLGERDGGAMEKSVKSDCAG